jgi:hypothetical protein
MKSAERKNRRREEGKKRGRERDKDRPYNTHFMPTS